MRLLFTDGGNSLAHFGFGVTAIWAWWIIPLYVTYQLVDPFEENFVIDLLEFFLGYGFAQYLLTPRAPINTHEASRYLVNVKATVGYILSE